MSNFEREKTNFLVNIISLMVFELENGGLYSLHWRSSSVKLFVPPMAGPYLRTSTTWSKILNMVG